MKTASSGVVAFAVTMVVGVLLAVSQPSATNASAAERGKAAGSATIQSERSTELIADARTGSTPGVRESLYADAGRHTTRLASASGSNVIPFLLVPEPVFLALFGACLVLTASILRRQQDS